MNCIQQYAQIVANHAKYHLNPHRVEMCSAVIVTKKSEGINPPFFKMRVFITGSEGFIGTHLKERLTREGHIVVGLDNLSHLCRFSKGDYINGDIRNIWSYYHILKKCDCIVHLAAQINVENH